MVAARGNARGDCSEEPGDIPGLGALRLPGPSAVGRGLETSCPARAGRKDGLIRPRAIFAARWVRNPGLGRFRAARETPGGKVRAPPAGTPPNPASLRPRLWPPGAAPAPAPTDRPALSGRSPRAGRPAPHAPRARSPPPPARGPRGSSGPRGGAAADGREGARAESPPARPSGPPARECHRARGVRAGGGHGRRGRPR